MSNMYCEMSNAVLCDPQLQPPRPLRLVTVWSSVVTNGPRTPQQLLLPEDDALELMAAFGSTKYQVQLVESATKDNGWVHRRALMAGVSLIARLADKLTAWLGEPRAKYLNVRIDLRGGDFLIINNSEQAFTQEVLQLVEEKL